MKALSVKQPWTWCILHAGKDIENRDWRSWNPGIKFRGDCLLHAGLKIDAAIMIDSARRMCLDANVAFPRVESLNVGGYVGVIEIVDVVQRHDSHWFTGPYGLVIRNPRPIPFYPAKGQLGFFNVDMTPQLEHFIKEAA